MVATFEPKELQRIVNDLFLYGKNVFSARLWMVTMVTEVLDSLTTILRYVVILKTTRPLLGRNHETSSTE